MIFLGVDLEYNQVAVSALSEGFVLLDELSLCMGDYAPFAPWLASLLLKNDEPVSWFFCEKKFIYWHDFPFFFDVPCKSHQFFLVKDRVVNNLYIMCRHLFLRGRFSGDHDLSRLLAASRGFFDNVYISRYDVPIIYFKF